MFSKIRNAALALAAVATLGTATLISTTDSADARGFGGGGFSRGGGGGMGMATTSTSTYVVGTLVVDIFDVMTKQLLFRGQAQETVNKNAEKNTEAMYKAMAKMFKDFPPTAAK